jgi:hypothetical protein
MHYLRLIFRSSIFLPLILYYWFTGVTPSEYKAKFATVKGTVSGPFINLYESFDLVINNTEDYDSINRLESQIRRHDLNHSYRKFIKEVKTHNLSWNNNVIDSFSKLPTQKQWDFLRTKNNGIVYSKDTVFKSEYIYPVEIPVHLSVKRSMYAKVNFSVGNHPQRFQIKFPKEDKGLQEGLPPLYNYFMATSAQSSSEYLKIKKYYNQLFQFLKTRSTLSVEYLKSGSQTKRVYKALDENNDVIFEDIIGLEGLTYKPDGSFNLWYEYWLVKAFIFIQIILYLAVISEISRSSNKNNPSHQQI